MRLARKLLYTRNKSGLDMTEMRRTQVLDYDELRRGGLDLGLDNHEIEGAEGDRNSEIDLERLEAQLR